MKELRYFSTMMLMFVMSLSLLSCGDDDEDETFAQISNFTVECERVTGGGLGNEDLSILRGATASLFYEDEIKALTRGVSVEVARDRFNDIAKAFCQMLVEGDFYEAFRANGDLYFDLALVTEKTHQVAAKKKIILNSSGAFIK